MKVPLIVCLSRNEERTGRARVPRQTVVDMYERARRPSPKDFDEIWEIDFEGDRIN
jgi:hypothetical protein